MVHRLTDDKAGVQAGIAPSDGAEIASLKIRVKERWIECLDRAMDFRPCDRWQGRAPWLWPAVGRSYTASMLANAQATGEAPSSLAWEHDGRAYPMPIHGFAMRRPWKVACSRVGDDGVELECVSKDDDETRRMYPFAFLLHLTYRLSEGCLRSVFRVEAARGNPSPMPACFGNHITLRAPLTDRGAFDDVRVLAPVRRVHSATALGLLGQSSEISFREGVPLFDNRLHNLILGHFSPDQATVRVVDPCGVMIDVSHRETTHPTPKAPVDAHYFVFYGSREHGFFCPEPWLGLPNALNTRQGCAWIESGDSFGWEMSLRLSAEVA